MNTARGRKTDTAAMQTELRDEGVLSAYFQVCSKKQRAVQKRPKATTFVFMQAHTQSAGASRENAV